MESMSSDSIIQNVNNNHFPTSMTTEDSSHPQSTIETFTATPSTFRRASASPPGSVPLTAPFLATEITSFTAVNGPLNMPPAQPPTNPTKAAKNEEQKEVARQRIISKVNEKYPGKPLEFRNRKVNKQMAHMFPEKPDSAATNGSFEMSSNTPTAVATPLATPQPQDSVESKLLSKNRESSSGTGAMDIDEDEDRSIQNRKQIPNSTSESTPRESSQIQELPATSRTSLQLPPASATGSDANGDVSMDDATEVNGAHDVYTPRERRRTSLPNLTTAKMKGVVMGFYKQSDVQNDLDKHAVLGKIDKGGDLFTTVTKETRRGTPVPSGQYLASKVQCSTDKICFEPHLEGLSKLQLKHYVLRRLEELESTDESPQDRKASELRIANEVRMDKSLTGPNPNPHSTQARRQPTVMTGVKRGYTAFADDNEDDDEDDESPLSEINENNFPDTDDEDAFVPTGGSKKRRAGRKSINARTPKGDEKDGDDIKKGVFIGVWRRSPAEADEDKHGVYSYLDARKSLWSRVFHITKAGNHSDMAIPFPRGTVKWDDIILDEKLSHMDREQVKQYVIEKRLENAELADEEDKEDKKDRKPRKSYGSEQAIKQEQSSAIRSKTEAVLLGYWRMSLEPKEEDKNAVYGYVDSSGRFNLQVRKHTRDGRELPEINPDFPGNGRVQKENMVLEDHLKDFNHAQIQAYTRKALGEGVANLTGEELHEAELRIANEIANEKPSDVMQEKPIDEPPRQKRKYTRRSIPQPPPEALAEGADESSMMRSQSRPQSRVGGGMYDPALPRPPPGYMRVEHPQPAYGYPPPNGVPGVVFGPNGQLIFNGMEFLPAPPPPAPPVIDETGTTITNNGLKYVQKTSGAFKGKFVHTNRELISINGEDYAEYRVLVHTDI